MHIVGIDHRHTLAAEPLVDRALLLRDLLHAAHALQVRALRVIDDRHRRLGQSSEIGDFARMVHAHLDHRGAVKVAQLEQGQRQADVVVQIAARGQHRLLAEAVPTRLRTQDGGAHLLDRGLAVAAGDADQRHGKACAPGRGQRPEREPGVVHDQQRQRRIRVRCRPGGIDHRRRCTGLGRGGNEIVAVEALAAQRDEELSGCQRTAVGAHALEAGQRGEVRPVRSQRARGIVQRHHCVFPRVCQPRRASRACSRSENGRRWPRISW